MKSKSQVAGCFIYVKKIRKSYNKPIWLSGNIYVFKCIAKSLEGYILNSKQLEWGLGSKEGFHYTCYFYIVRI